MPLKVKKDTLTPMLKREANAHADPASLGYQIVTRLLADGADHLQYLWTTHIKTDPPYSAAEGATGLYGRSITVDPTMYWSGTQHRRKVYCNVTYGIYIERGTGPAIGNPPFHIPMSAISGLEAWIRRKGLKMNAYQLAKSIGKKGTRPRPHHRHAMADLERDWPALERKALNDVMGAPK